MLANVFLMLGPLLCHFYVGGIELTFELPDRREQCFHQVVTSEMDCSLEYQVVTGGNFDVDVTLADPTNTQLYSKNRQQYDSFDFRSTHPGEYTFCFSNEFSSLTHKQVYFEFTYGEAPIDPAESGKHTALTHMETKALSIHTSLNIIIDYQTHHRIRETHGRSVAEGVNERVLWWSLMESVIIVMISLAQLLILRWFFVEKKSSI